WEGGGWGELSGDGRKSAAANTDVALALAIMIDHRAAFEDQIVGVSHAGMRLNGLEACLTALTFRREFWQETIERDPRESHAGSSSPRSRCGQGLRRRRPALP